MLNALFTSLISSVCLISSISIGVTNYYRQPVNRALDPEANYYYHNNSSANAPTFVGYDDLDSRDITTEFYNFATTTTTSTLTFRSIRMNYDRDNYDAISSLLGKVIFSISPYYTNPTPPNPYNEFAVYLDNLDVYDFGFQPIFKSTFSIMYQYRVLITTEFYDSSDTSFYTVSTLYGFNNAVSRGGGGTDATYPTTYYDSFILSSTSNSYDFSYQNSSLDTLVISITLIHDVTISSEDSYSIGYSNGYNAGYIDGNASGYATGYSEGRQAGSSYRSLFFSIADTPVVMLRSLFNFEFFGMNFFIIVVSMLTFLFLLYIVKKVIK